MCYRAGIQKALHSDPFSATKDSIDLETTLLLLQRVRATNLLLSVRPISVNRDGLLVAGEMIRNVDFQP